jgi:hypothetical protein
MKVYAYVKFYTHGDPLPPGKEKKAKRLWILIHLEYGMMAAFFLFFAVTLSILDRSLYPALLILGVFGTLFTIIAEMMWNFCHAYVATDGEHIHVVDYCFWRKREKHLSMSEITHAKIWPSYSMRIPGDRVNVTGGRYIVFYDACGKARFKLLCEPRAKAYFQQYMEIEEEW